MDCPSNGLSNEGIVNGLSNEGIFNGLSNEGLVHNVEITGRYTMAGNYCNNSKIEPARSLVIGESLAHLLE